MKPPVFNTGLSKLTQVFIPSWQDIKCHFGYHKWKDTGIMRMFGFIRTFECTNCGEQIETAPTNVDFENIGGVECMRIKL
jgi:hypothetical protein